MNHHHYSLLESYQGIMIPWPKDMQTMRAHYLQHVPFEGLGSIKPWFVNEGYEITCSQLYKHCQLPDLNTIDFLVIMGGPMSIHDEALFPWLVQEKQFIHRAIQSGIPILGICLGAQLIVSAMGGKVYPHHEKEIGWHPIYNVALGDNACMQFPNTAEAFHWHGETFDLPTGALHLAKSDCCNNQAFQLGTSVIGLQFHLETTPDTAHDIVANCRAELVTSDYVQSETEILQASPEKYQTINQLMTEILNYLQNSQSTKA